MTEQERQAALDWFKSHYCQSECAHYKTVVAALQSPRVPDNYFSIPKLPDGWEIFCLGRYREDGKHGYWLETRNTASGYLCRECNIPIAYGETIEDVFNKMKNKILDSWELTRRITEGGKK